MNYPDSDSVEMLKNLNRRKPPAIPSKSPNSSQIFVVPSSKADAQALKVETMSNFKDAEGQFLSAPFETTDGPGESTLLQKYNSNIKYKNKNVSDLGLKRATSEKIDYLDDCIV